MMEYSWGWNNGVAGDGMSAHLLAHNLHPPTMTGTSRAATANTLSTGTRTATRRMLSRSIGAFPAESQRGDGVGG